MCLRRKSNNLYQITTPHKKHKMIQKQYDNFSSRLADINDYHSLNLDLVKTSYEKLEEQENILKTLENEKTNSEPWRGTRFYSLDPYTNEKISIGGAVISKGDDDLYGLKFIHNKQIQWLLVDAYEAFEEYLKSVYAYAGYLDNNLWSLADFGNISLNEIKNLDLDWFKEKTNKTSKPDKILNQLKKKIPEFSNSLENNKPNIDYNYRLSVVEHIRHIIVHRNGYIKNEDEFIKKILEKIGKYNNGKFDQELEDYIKQFYCDCTKKNENIIRLNRVYFNDSGLTMFHDKFSFLIQNLASYAIIINKSLNNHIKT